MKQLRIAGDITGNSVVLVMDDGTEVRNVTRATVYLDANDWNRVELEVVGVQIVVAKIPVRRATTTSVSN